MWESIKQFVYDNDAAIIISLVIGAIFFILGPLGLWFSGKKVKREKILKAKSELLDLIESMLVNDEKITISKLITLFRAVERQNGNNLGLDSDLNNTLEDLTLRFAKSKHLSSEQKDNYIQKIDGLISSIEDNSKKSAEVGKREIPKSLKSIINELKAESEAQNIDRDKLSEQIGLLERKFMRPSERDFSSILVRIFMDRKIFRWVMISYLLVLVILFIIKYLYD